jgi:CBS domain-containing protein
VRSRRGELSGRARSVERRLFQPNGPEANESQDLSLRSLLSIRPEDDLAEAARRMSLNHADCLLVMSGNRRAGIITASDLVRAMAAGFGPRDVSVADSMSSDPATIDPAEARPPGCPRMRAIGVRHLAVVEDCG